jgi:hypothetical protein
MVATNISFKGPTIMTTQNNGSGNQTPSAADIEALRLPASYGGTLGVKKILTTVPVGKPKKTQFFRAHPSPDMSFDVLLLEDKDNREYYILNQEVAQVLSSLVRPTTLRAAIDRNDNVFLIPVPLPDGDGKRNQWHQSLAQNLQHAESNWIRMTANMHVGGYDVYQAESRLEEPEWPEANMAKLIEVAFRGKVITTLDHPIVQSLLGRA